MVQILVYIVIVLLIIYGFFIMLYRYLWSKLQHFWVGENEKDVLKSAGGRRFSIIIPARNEQDNIASCLYAILQGNYPASLFDVTVVDDFSTDATGEIIRRIQLEYPGQVKIIELAKVLDTRPINSYKKKALELAIGQSSGDWIVTTDADCSVPVNWLNCFNDYLGRTEKRFVAAPVRFTDTGSFVSKFQCLDFLSLQGVTGAAVAGGLMSMCNGANLCYEKLFFYEVGGFSGIDKLASGDDMFLMQKMQQQQPGSTGYLFSQQAIVSTLPMPDWRSFFNQRIRWASKAAAYKDWKIKLVLLIVYLLNLGLVALFLSGLFYPALLGWWLGLIVFKFIIEYFFMRPVARFFRQEKLLNWFLVMQPFHTFYTVIAGWLGLFGKYNWKGRSVK